MQLQEILDLVQTGFDDYAPLFWIGLLVLLLALTRTLTALRRLTRKQQQLIEDNRERLTQVETELSELKIWIRTKITPVRKTGTPQPKRVEKLPTGPTTDPEPASWTNGESATRPRTAAESSQRTLDCRNCGQQIKYSPAQAGRQLKCSACRVTVKLA